MAERAPGFTVSRDCWSTGFGSDVTLIEIGVYRFFAAKTSFELALGFTLSQPMLGQTRDFYHLDERDSVCVGRGGEGGKERERWRS